MQRHAQAKQAQLSPLLGKERALGLEGRGHGGGSGKKHRLHRVANGLEMDVAMSQNSRVDQSNVLSARMEDAESTAVTSIVIGRSQSSCRSADL